MTGSLFVPQSKIGFEVSPDSAPPQLMVSVIGGVSLTYSGHEVNLNTRKSLAMVAYLALSQTGVERRERLAGLLWSESSEQNARVTLRQSLHETRKAMLAVGSPPLVGDRNAIGLQPGSFRVDLLHLMDAVALQEVPDVLLRQERLAEALLPCPAQRERAHKGFADP